MTHRDADCLSRYPLRPAGERDEEDALAVPTYLLEGHDIAAFQLQDDRIRELINALQDTEYGNVTLRKCKNFVLNNNVLYKKNTRTDGNDNLLVILREMRTESLYQNHNEFVAGHLGFSKTFNRIRDRYYWDFMQGDVEKYVKGCPECQARKGQTNLRSTGLLKPFTIVQPFDRVGIDLLGPFRKSKP